MLSKGYALHSNVTHPKWLANDFIFVKRSLLNGPNGLLNHHNIDSLILENNQV